MQDLILGPAQMHSFNWREKNGKDDSWTVQRKTTTLYDDMENPKGAEFQNQLPITTTLMNMTDISNLNTSAPVKLVKGSELQNSFIVCCLIFRTVLKVFKLKSLSSKVVCVCGFLSLFIYRYS